MSLRNDRGITLIEKAKSALEIKLDEAKMSLVYNDGIHSMFFASKDGVVFEDLPLTAEPDLQEAESLQMKILCSNQDIKIAATLIDCNTVTVPNEDVGTIEGDLKDHPDNVDCILLILSTRDRTLVRTIPYVRKGDKDYWFGDQGWQNVDESSGLFENVFKKIS